jgi:hypothetical protein
VPNINPETQKRSRKDHRFNLLTRTRSTSSRGGEEGAKAKDLQKSRDGGKVGSKPSTPRKMPEKEHSLAVAEYNHPPMKSAPLEKDRGFREMIGSSMRNRSLDRHGGSAVESDDEAVAPSREKRDGFGSFSTSFQERSSGLLSNIRSQGSKAADGIGKAGKGFFGKFARGNAGHEKESIQPEDYRCKVINLPLVEQTRKTRISQRLEDSKDKTEFWMPALPWRCIDYLNMKGCEEEGLYRIPGSGKDIKKWQMRFDTGMCIGNCVNSIRRVC